jgi:hypothetical protein
MLPEGSVPLKDFGWHGVLYDPALKEQCMKTLTPLAEKWYIYEGYTLFYAPGEKQVPFVKELEKNCIWDCEFVFQRILEWKGE